MGHEEKNCKVLKLAEERYWECLFLVSLTGDEGGLQPNLKTEKSNSFHKKEVLIHTMCDKVVELTGKITKARPCFLITVWIWTVLMTFHFFFICTLSQPHEIFLICFYVGFCLFFSRAFSSFWELNAKQNIYCLVTYFSSNCTIFLRKFTDRAAQLYFTSTLKGRYMVIQKRSMIHKQAMKKYDGCCQC